MIIGKVDHAITSDVGVVFFQILRSGNAIKTRMGLDSIRLD